MIYDKNNINNTSMQMIKLNNRTTLNFKFLYRQTFILNISVGPESSPESSFNSGKKEDIFMDRNWRTLWIWTAFDTVT